MTKDELMSIQPDEISKHHIDYFWDYYYSWGKPQLEYVQKRFAATTSKRQNAARAVVEALLEEL